MSKNKQILEEQIKQDRFRNFNVLLYKDTTSYKYRGKLSTPLHTSKVVKIG